MPPGLPLPHQSGHHLLIEPGERLLLGGQIGLPGASVRSSQVEPLPATANVPLEGGVEAQLDGDQDAALLVRHLVVDEENRTRR